MSTLSKSAWLCMGDFNEIVHSREMVGGAIHSATQMRKFRATLEECNLGDPGYQGSKFTWSNKQASDRFVKERLDRAVATPDWCAHFVNAVVEILPASTSDHRPLCLQFDSRSQIAPKLFRFEAK
jgi:endonuclease/exonuclease/phosphatase family metal-dependent hydrolase